MGTDSTIILFETMESISFTNEEKVLFASAFVYVHKEIITTPIMNVYIALKDKSLLKLSGFCMDRILEVGVTPEIAEKTPVSEYVWNNMSLEKKQYLIKQLNQIEKEVQKAGGVAAETICHFARPAILDFYRKLKTLPSHHDENGFHFKELGI